MEGRQGIMGLGQLPEFMFLEPADMPKCVWNIPIMMARVTQDTQ